MADRNFMKMVGAKWADTLLCVGLDIDPGKISKKIEALIRKEDNLPPSGATGPLMLGFNKRIIEATKDLVCAYKPNLGFYLAQGIQGIYALQETVEFIRKAVPDVPAILDGKFGDVGSSAAQYARFVFEVIGADALTVNPWGGKADSVDVFLEYRDKGIFIWCKGSNKGAKEVQDLLTLPVGTNLQEILDVTRGSSVGPFLVATRLEEWSGEAMLLYQRMAHNVSCNWDSNGNCAVVVGATYPEELKKVRLIVGDNMPILIPGAGTQGGDLEMAVRNGVNSMGDGIIVNSSSGIIYKSSGRDFAEAARKEAKRLRDEINKNRQPRKEA